MGLLHALSLLHRSAAALVLCVAMFLAGALLPLQRVVRLGFLCSVLPLALWLLLLQELHYLDVVEMSVYTQSKPVNSTFEHNIR